MSQKRLAGPLFFAVAVLSLLAALVPLARGGEMNAVFLPGAVVFFVIGIAASRNADQHRS